MSREIKKTKWRIFVDTPCIYAEEDINYTLDEIFPDKNSSLEAYEPCKPRSAEHFCTVKMKDAKKKFR